jgi:tetratricopeptide (TPR) repeat protein
MRASFLLFAVFLVLAPAVAGAMTEEASRACTEAADAYDSTDFGRAAELYESVLDDGIDAAVIHYNLGNARFKQGQLGLAIASYLRAARIDPRDPKIRTNIRRARAQIKDVHLSGESLPPVLRPLQWGYAYFSANEWLALAVVLWVLLLALRMFNQWRPLSRSRVRPASGTLLALALAAFLVGGLRYYRDFVVERGVIIAEEVDVRSGPGSDYNLAFRIHEGLPVRVAEDRGDWLRIDLGGELVGWVPASMLEAI